MPAAKSLYFLFSKNMLIQPVILSGGSGTRLWPLSREKYPKQLLPLIGDDSLLQATVRRVEGIAGIELAAPMVVCNEEYRFVIAEQLRVMGKPGCVVLEPKGRNTAPAATGKAGTETPVGMFRVDARHLTHTSSLYKTANDEEQ